MSLAASGSGSSSSVDGLVSGLDTTAIIKQLMQIEQQPQQSIITKRDKLSNQITLWQTLQTDIQAISDKSKALNINTYWKPAKATTSDDTIATATAVSGALPGTLSFKVLNLAQSNIKSSAGSVTDLTSQVATQNFLMAQAGSIGLNSMHGSAGMALGDHTFVVTTASTGASQTGAAVADSVTVNPGDTISVNISGTPQTIALTAGTYTRRELSDMISTASGGTVNATVAANKGLTLTSAREGTAATMQITASSNSFLGLSATGTSAGTDGVITVDGVSNTLSDINPNSTTPVTLNGAGADTVDVTFVRGLRAGTVTAKNISYGDGSLQTIATNINSSGAGVTATAVQVGSGQFKLQLTSQAQGVSGSIATDDEAFATNLGSLDSLVKGKDAKIVVGSGPNEYSLTSQSNNVTTILPNITVNLTKADPTTEVTVTVDKDYQSVADKVKDLIDTVNKALSYINDNTKYNATTKTAGAMLGDSTFEQIRSQLTSAVNDIVSKSSYQSTAAIGITLQQDGTYKFDEDTFMTQYRANPEEMTKLFIEGGTTGAGVDGTAPGVVDRLINFESGIDAAGTGMLWNKLQSGQSQVSDWDKEVTDWDVRLAAKEQQLRTQFSQMEVLLGQMKNTQSQVGGQFARLS